MKHILLLFLSLCAAMVNAQTYFYKLTSVSTNGVKQAGDNSGIFLTFTKNGCYVSDKDGISDNTGFLHYQGQNGNAKYYKGKSVYGESSFYLSLDNSILNIPVGNMTLVYHKSGANGQSKSKYYAIGSHQQSPSSADHDYNMDYLRDKYQMEREMLENNKRKWTPCITCNGSGKCSWCAGRGYTIVNGEMMDCKLCRGGGRCNTCHGQGGYKL